MIGAEDVANSILQYWQIFLGMLMGSIIHLFFKEFIYEEFLSPSLRYKVNYFKNKIKKHIGNTVIQLSYSSSTNDIDSHEISKEKIHDIAEYLKRYNIDVLEQGDLLINNFPFGRTAFSGTIEFDSTSTVKEEILRGFLITINAKVGFNSMNDEISTIIQGMSKLKEYISNALGIPIQYSDYISCKLTKLVVQLSEAMRDMKINYINFSGDIDASMNKDKIVFKSPIDPSIVLPQLRKLVVLYS